MSQPSHDPPVYAESTPSRESIDQALQTLDLAWPLSVEDLNQRCRELLLTWHPHRYAGLTNSPAQYMQMYKKGEAMSKAVQEAYRILSATLTRG
ncbi:MAG: hypothetical protein GKS05_02875 [Nitrospirales bacterium]|nr:hypothetical protein [Nitrospirales bacterium]